MAPAMVVPGVSAIPAVVAVPSSIIPRIIIPGIIIPGIIEPRVVPSSIPTVVVRAVVPRIIPTVVVERTIIPRVVPSAVIPGVVTPVDGGVERAVPGIPGGRVPRLVSRPSVPTVVIQVNGRGILTLVEIYLRHLVIRDEQGVDLLSTFHEDRGTLCLSDQQVGLFLEVGRGCHFCR